MLVMDIWYCLWILKTCYGMDKRQFSADHAPVLNAAPRGNTKER